MNNQATEYYKETPVQRRNRLLTGYPLQATRDAWFALSHLFLDEGAKIADIGCGEGLMTYAMAVMNPDMIFIGVDKNRRQINKAKETYNLPNLQFIAADATDNVFEPETLDAIINSFTLHEVYSSSRYNERSVSETMAAQFKALKKGGTMFIRDYACPPPEQFVLLEMPDKPSESDDVAGLSEADFLVWYSTHSRPRNDPGTGGFFLEELPERFPGTRLFRLPYKWAYEFILRKDDRQKLERELPIEYTYFTADEMRKQLRSLGARVQYSGPYWDEDISEKKTDTSYKLYQDDGTPLGNPPSGFVAVAMKMAERKSLHIEERRPANAADSKLVITAMRDSKTGKVRDIVERNESYSDIIPYRVDEHGMIKIYLHDGIARSIANAVPRAGGNIDGKKWSGHMIEAISIKSEIILEIDKEDSKSTALFARDHLGLKPQHQAQIEKGNSYYPAPDYINEQIYTYYLKVDKATVHITPRATVGGTTRFQAKGIIREFDAQQVLNAISVGMIPNQTLELQILALYNHLGIIAETWTSKIVNMKAGEITARTDLAKLMAEWKDGQARFREIKGTAGDLRAIHSVFVEEGQARGSISGLSSQDIDFVVHEDQTVNKAVVMPLTLSLKKEIHAGFLLEQLPVPERQGGKSTTISVPSFDLPRHINNARLARKYIADQFEVLPEMVIKMGEPYFCHIGLTPQRIFPFAVTVPPDYQKDPNTQFMPLFQLALMSRYKSLANSTHFMVAVARCYKYLSGDVKYHASLGADKIIKERFAFSTPDWGIPMRYETPPMLKQEQQPAPAPEPVQVIPFHAKEKPAAPKPQAIDPESVIKLKSESEFEEEIENFLEELQQFTNAPKPEKW